MGLFGRWFSPKCPIDLPSKLWIEKHLAWLRDQFGSDRLIESPIIEPTDDFFPDVYDSTPHSMLRIFHRVCNFMEVSTDIVELQFFRNNNTPFLVTEDGFGVGVAAGTYQQQAMKHVIRLDEENSFDPMNVVSTLAHELAHLRLMGEDRIDPSRWDNELLTDLCSIYFGFGVFRTNRPAYSPPSKETWPGTGLWRPEYMTTAMNAYALALIASVRFEEKPKWASHLKGSAKTEFASAMKWINRPNQS